MTQPHDQRLLYRDLCLKLDRQGDPDQLIAFMGEVLRSLLRRKGDAEFLLQVQDAFTTGLAGLGWDEQVALAREVIALVIAKRPEVALAWQQLHGEAAPLQRRASDRPDSPAPDLDDLPDLDLIGDDLALDVEQPGRPATEEAAPPPLEPPYEFATAEALVAKYVCGVLERRLAIFAAPETRFPSVAYCHEQPFFLLTPTFSTVARRFVTEAVMKLCREPMERHVFRHIPTEVIADARALDAVLTEKRPDLWKILVERLGKLAAHHRNAEAKVTAARAVDGEPEFQVVEVPVSRPRVFRALGVAFRLGSRTQLEKMKVRVRPTTELDRYEMQALDLIARFRDMAAQAGLDLPAACDFTFLRTLLEFDAKKYAQAVREFTALAGHKETTRQFLLERLKYIDETYANTLSDALVILMFYGAGDDNFGFKAIYDICIGTALDDSARASKRPFLQSEIGRRPRELAFQVREVLRRRYDEDTLRAAVKALLDTWQTMARTRFKGDMEAALTVFAAFPIAFAGDHDEQLFTAIGHMLHRALTAKEPHFDETLEAVVEAYRPVAAKLRAEARG
jgi:hypothetical protein